MGYDKYELEKIAKFMMVDIERSTGNIQNGIGGFFLANFLKGKLSALYQLGLLSEEGWNDAWMSVNDALRASARVEE